MRESVTRREVLTTCALGTSAALAGCTSATPFVGKRTEFNREFDLAEGRLDVETDGEATVTRTDADTVQLHGVKEAASLFRSLEDMTVESTREGDRLRIVAESGGRGTISLDVGVPAGVAVEGVATQNGNAVATGVSGNALLTSMNGEVRARNVDGTVSLRTMNGDVRARDVTAIGGAETTNGDVTIDVPAVNGEVRASSTNGDINAALASALDATVVARTNNGDVSTRGLEFESAEHRENYFRGTLGEGTHRLTLSSQNGDVTLSILE